MVSPIGPEAHAFAVKRNETRIRRSEIRISDDSKEVTTARSAERISENIQLEVKEGPLCRTGIAD